jgi:16S rRNA (uracil1498-N3)-methyltransferase
MLRILAAYFGNRTPHNLAPAKTEILSNNRSGSLISDNRGVNPRFYVPDAERAGGLVDLPQEEARHLTRVLRLKPGAAIRIFNGRGGEFDATVNEITKGRVLVRLTAAREAVSEPGVAITLAQAVLKGDKMDAVVRDAVMMGVAAIQPMVTTRAEVSLAPLKRGGRRERWERIAISSAKQCGRATVPSILEPRSLPNVVSALTGMTLPGPGLMLVEPSASGDMLTLADLKEPAPRETTVLIGPEGGWTQEEIELASSACRLITLGARTLRADAMALVALTALFAVWREF